MDHLYTYTDGSCLKNPDGPGGWAFIILDQDNNIIHKEFEGVTSTSNNKMELTAAIKVLSYISSNYPDPVKIELFSDSQYVVKGIKDWIHGWIKKNWITSSGSDVLNKDLWIILNNLRNSLVDRKFEIKFSWVKAHSGNLWNERVDLMANQAAKSVESNSIVMSQSNPNPNQSFDENVTPFDADFQIKDIITSVAESTKDSNLSESGEIIQYSSTLSVKELIDDLKKYNSNSLIFIEYGRLVIKKGETK